MHLRSTFAALVIGTTLLSTASAAEPVNAESSITAVTVYQDRAIVTRQARVDLTAGAQEILFAGLPYSLDPDLLQVAGSGTAQATILDVRAATAQLEAPANPRFKELQEQARTLQAELRTITDRVAVLNQQRDYLEKIKVATTTPAGRDNTAGSNLPAIDQWERLVTFYADSLGKLSTQLQELDRQREDTQSRINAVQRQIADLEASARKSVQNVVVRIDVTEGGSMDVSLSYTVDAASWSPTYDVRVSSADRNVTLGYAAMVRQSSGEDWDNVQLTLSTARPAIGGTPPELSTWFVDEQRRLTVMTRQQMSDEAAAYEATTASQKTRGLAFADAQVETGLTSATFTIASPAQIPADNAPHKVAITTHPLEAELSHLTIPKLAELAYLRAAVTNNSDYPLMAGPVNLFVDGTYVARSAIKTVMPQEKFELDLGVDDGISVERKLLNRLQENAGWVTRQTRVIYDVLITLQNNRPTPSRIIVKDQLPISRHERITVALLAPPAREVVKSEDGTLTWTLDLKPGEKRELPLKIAVEHPADLPISGLD